MAGGYFMTATNCIPGVSVWLVCLLVSFHRVPNEQEYSAGENTMPCWWWTYSAWWSWRVRRICCCSFIGLEIMFDLALCDGGLASQRWEIVEAEWNIWVWWFFFGVLLYGIRFYLRLRINHYNEITAYFLAKPTSARWRMRRWRWCWRFAFKIAAVPFHFWSPERLWGRADNDYGIYVNGPEGGGVCRADSGFGILCILLLIKLEKGSLSWIAVITMLVGNVSALKQTSISACWPIRRWRMRLFAGRHCCRNSRCIRGDRLLPGGTHDESWRVCGNHHHESAAGHGVITLRHTARDGICASGVRRDDEIFMLSLTGMPRRRIFSEKLYVFSAAIQQGYIVLAVAGLINSAIAAYYYLRIITCFICISRKAIQQFLNRLRIRFSLVVLSILILLIGMFPEPWSRRWFRPRRRQMVSSVSLQLDYCTIWLYGDLVYLIGCEYWQSIEILVLLIYTGNIKKLYYMYLRIRFFIQFARDAFICRERVSAGIV